MSDNLESLVYEAVKTGLAAALKDQGKVIVDRSQVMDKTTNTNIVLAFAEIKSLAESLVSHPDNDEQRIVAEHILTIIKRNFKERTE